MITFAKADKRHLTFRAAATSLSGQVCGNDIIVNLNKYPSGFYISDNGKHVLSSAMAIGGQINSKLIKFQRKLGPDPASINSCTVGGMLANNSSGMASGIKFNPYNTVKSIKYLLPNGLLIDSSNTEHNNLLMCHDNIGLGLLRLKDIINTDIKIKNKIINKYQIKNTVGYSLNSFLDFDSPLDILSHLMIGSEGTLGFISEVEFYTIALKPYKTTFLCIFPDISLINNCIIALRELGAVAIELMDSISLQSVQHNVGMPKDILSDLPKLACGLLFEFSNDSSDNLLNLDEAVRKIISSFNPLNVISSREAQQQQRLWKIRQGLLPALGKSRQLGTSVIIEDLAFRSEDFSKAFIDLRLLLDKFDYHKSGIYGHGMDGNVHFIIAEDFSNDTRKANFDKFINELSELVIDKYNGSLKAEHGTGRSIAPFVEKEWGKECYDIIKEIKILIDPCNILNPDIIISDNPQIHLENIKALPILNSEADSCIDCGYCEPSCPSKNLTFSPRQRIALLRDMASNHSMIGFSDIKNVSYYLEQTCATDSLCKDACPVDIDTGNLIKKIRNEKRIGLSKFVADLIASELDLGVSVIKFMSQFEKLISKIISKENVNRIINRLNRSTFFEIPQLNNLLQTASKTAPVLVYNSSKLDLIYFKPCFSRIFTSENHDYTDPVEAHLLLATRAGLNMKLMKENSDLCCGMAFSSKGFKSAFIISANKFVDESFKSSNEGAIPVLIDSSSCAFTINNYTSEILSYENYQKFKSMKFIDSIDFLSDYIIPKVKIRKSDMTIAAFANCGAKKSNNETKFYSIASHCSNNIISPVSNACCGFAGDRGLIFPELYGSSLKNFSDEINVAQSLIGISSNLPCESALADTCKIPFYSIVQLIEKLSR